MANILNVLEQNTIQDLASHGLSDVNRAAVDFGLADEQKLERLWPRLMAESAFWAGDMPTQLVTKPFAYEK